MILLLRTLTVIEDMILPPPLLGCTTLMCHCCDHQRLYGKHMDYRTIGLRKKKLDEKLNITGLFLVK
ncbi:hypothetical protein AV530_002860 [Patagioenas fasciata monilis]|uniref:Uncharacterized protein n=1 Tax=Patagioenas fasciata monilis TaxID=372326 RepID=A0A1V4K9P0_PATFA|nr:hypothetical protein AV530_002860 [Patagioenas fasciata monilis]